MQGSSSVGPTKYVAVGPTLSQRLGFGWRMVSMLAGIGSEHRMLMGCDTLNTGAEKEESPKQEHMYKHVRVETEYYWNKEEH